ncbi:GPP34 family phosphoprotein [Roseomonas sp. SSH11]|uniref:GPP34 family phosphoprotein n=1 Tax=Pararoseomonas baculiformis TaxID=2820812 RepID=A0ABS4AHE8_9PROT|nr:GPP34 family phosphoprotein [Pararoseomonas baculiformis]MBP0445644.1 GPP34 family phosphoprotein [Pararoseomonas baculiformis]
MPLTMPEELILLMLDDRSGRLNEMAGPASGYAIAGAILAELALHNRIDTDPQRLYVTDPSPTGDPLLDRVLARIAADPGPGPDEGDFPHGSRWWIETLGRESDSFREQIFARLVQRGILREEMGRFLWIFPERRYPVISDKEEREVKARLTGVIFDDDIPEPRDSLLIGLCRAAGLLPLILAEETLEAAEPRIAQVANLEELSRSLGNAVRDIFVEMARYTPLM